MKLERLNCSFMLKENKTQENINRIMQERLKSPHRTRQFLWIKIQNGAGTVPFQGLALEGVGVLRFPLGSLPE